MWYDQKVAKIDDQKREFYVNKYIFFAQHKINSQAELTVVIIIMYIKKNKSFQILFSLQLSFNLPNTLLAT